MSNFIKIPSLFFDPKWITEKRKLSQQYSNKEDLWSWYVLRRVSIYFSVLFIKMKLTPNFVSWLSLVFILLSGQLLLFSTPSHYVLAFLSYNLGYLLDCVDGEVARLQKNTSKRGVFIDYLIQAASLPVYISILLTLLINFNILFLGHLATFIVYFSITSMIMALFIPISFQLVQLEKSTQDPVNQMRVGSMFFGLLSFFLGLPGFFVSLVILQGIEQLLLIHLTHVYTSLFLLSLVLKSLTRLLLTVRKT